MIRDDKIAPVVLIGLMTGGYLLFGLIGSLGILIFGAGLIYGFVHGFDSLATLMSSKRRRANGIFAPILKILIAFGAWAIVINETLRVVHGLQQRSAEEEKSLSSCLDFAIASYSRNGRGTHLWTEESKQPSA